MLDHLLRNLRYAVRSLARTPAFTATAVLTLALGLGANVAVFSAMDAVLLQPLPFPDADRLVHLAQTSNASGETTVAHVRIEDWNRSASALEAISGHQVEDVADSTAIPAQRVRRAVVSPRFLAVWRVPPIVGRAFEDSDHRVGARDVVLISERYWRTRMDRDPNVLGRTTRVGDRIYGVVGVLPDSFAFPDRSVDWWMPAPVDAPWTTSRQNIGVVAVGRLKPGVTVAQAHANLADVQARLGELYPNTDATIGVRVTPYKERLVGGAGRSLWLLFGSVSILLVIACANIAALLLTRGAKRRRELAVRCALGASHASLVTQTFAEAAVLACAGSVAGVVVATATTATFRLLAPDLPRLDEAAVNFRVLAFVVASVLVTTLLCGVFPALRTARLATFTIVRSAEPARRRAWQWLPAGIQVACSVILLAGAGLLLRSADRLSRVDPGFDAERVLTFRVSGSYAEPGDFRSWNQRIVRLLDELNAVPGIDAAATSLWLPGIGNRDQVAYTLVERQASESQVVAEWRVVSSTYFDAMRIPVVSGELCRQTGGWMVNRRLAERYATASSIVGLHLARSVGPSGLRTDPAGVRIVGVVDDAREIGVDQEPVPTVYGCFSAPTPSPWFLVRTAGDPAAVAGAVRVKVNEIEPLRAIYDVVPLADRIGDAHAQSRLRTVLLTLFACCALGLACLGIYSALSSAVGQRRHEVGVRLALGANRSSILRQFLWEGVRAAAIASATGFLLSLATSRVLSGMLYEVTPSDPATLGGVVGVVIMVAALASLIPATRAALLPPMRILREE